MYSKAKETARLYQLLSNKLGNDTAEVMFKYIDNKTERSVEATIKTLATKEDILNDTYGLIAMMKKNYQIIFRWQLFFFVLNVLSTCIIFWWALK
jgi:hypothetical protein